MSLGCCCNRCVVTLSRTNYTNASTVAGYPDTPTPPIAPYIRPDEVDRPDECGDGDQPRCGPWPRDERPVVGDCAGTFQNWNCYVAAETTTPFTQDKQGHKVIQSVKQWHGRKSFTDCTTGCDAEPPRYLTLAVTATVDLTNSPDSGDDFTSSYIASFSVGQTSGHVTGSGSNTASSGGDGALGFSEAQLKLFSQELANIRYLCDEWNGPIATGLETPPALAAARALAYGVWMTLNGDTTLLPGATIDINSPSGDTLEFQVTWLTGDGGQQYVCYGLIELTDQYTPSELLTDAKTASATWLLSNNYYLPWRIDGYRGKGPIVGYDEGAPASPEVGAPDLPYDDGLENDGTSLGHPFAGGWPDYSFDFNHVTWADCNTTPVPTEYGAFSDGTIIPHTSSVFTNNYESGILWEGFGLWYDEDTKTLRLQKGCEVKEVFPGHNFFEPCAATRWLMDTGYHTDGSTAGVTTDLIASISGSDNRFIETTVALTDIAAGDLVSCRGTGITGADGLDDKIRRVVSRSGVNIELETSAYALPVPADYINAAYTSAGWDGLGQGTYGRIGRLRFQETNGGVLWPAMRAIAGRIAATGVFSAGSTVFTLAANDIIPGDKIDALDGSYSSVGSNLTVTNIGSGTVTVAGDYSTAVWLKSTSAPHYLWNDASSTGNFVEQVWLEDTDTGTVSTTPENTDIVKAGTCPVLACTPNADAPADAYVRAFPSSLTPTICGARWWCKFFQRLPDPVYQEPVADAVVDLPVRYVEARTGIIPGTRGGSSCPALPSGCAFQVPTTPPTGAGWSGGCTLNAHEMPWDGL